MDSNLHGGSVDEESDYRREAGVDERIKAAAETLFDWSRPNAPIPDYCVDSLRQAIVELQRFQMP